MRVLLQYLVILQSIQIFFHHSTGSYHVGRQRCLEVEQHADGSRLLQPLTARVLAVFLVLASVVEVRPQRRQELLGQCAHSAHRTLAEDHVPLQLQSRVWGREEWMRGVNTCLLIVGFHIYTLHRIFQKQQHSPLPSIWFVCKSLDRRRGGVEREEYNQIKFYLSHYTWLADVNASVAKCLCF